MNERLQKELELEKLQKEYLEYIDVSDKTIETYNIALHQFSKYLKIRGIKSPTRETIIDFRNDLKESHSIATINSYLIAVRNFFKFLNFKGIYPNITENLKGLKDTDVHKRDALSVETCKQLIDSADNIREKMIIMLTLTCGLRANEVVNVRLEDFREYEGQLYLYVLGKGRDGKTDFVIVPNSLISDLKKYIEEYNITDYLFVSQSPHNFGGKLDPVSVRRVANKLYDRLGIKTDRVVFHSLRHSFATISIENGENIREVSQALRHKNIATTERYLHDLEVKNNKCSSVVFNLLEHRND